MKGELYINGKDAWTTWGIGLEGNSLSALMTPPSLKEFVCNESRLEHGRFYILTHPKMKERELTIRLHLYATNEQMFYTKWNDFINHLLTSGKLNISTIYQSGVTYKCIYNGCTQYSQFKGRIAKFALRLIEPNPSDRTPPI